MATYAYEDLPTGETIDLGKVEIDRDDMVRFAERFDPQPFHLDEEAARKSLFGGLCASGWYTMSLWMRAYADRILRDSTSQGSPGGSELSWKAPVYPGDVLRFLLHVDGKRLSGSKPGLGLVHCDAIAEREGQEVMRFTFVALFGTRDSADSSAASYPGNKI